MKLTRRQEEFVANLHQLHQELDGPIHYSLLAERLGVSPFTAYDMLCLLEEKGLVTSQYRLASDKSGPGRAERVFTPSPEAQVHGRRILEEAGLGHLDPQALSQVVLERLRGGVLPHQELAQEMLARIPPGEQRQELRYCMEVMAVMVLRLRRSRGRGILAQSWADLVPGDKPLQPSNLCLLGGFVFGILAGEYSSNPDWMEVLSEHMDHYREIVAGLSPRESEQLGRYVVELFAPSNAEITKT